MEMTVGEMFKGIVMGGMMLIFVSSVIFLIVEMRKMFVTFRSYMITRRFSSEDNEERMELQRHLMKYGMSRKESADCMNNWKGGSSK